jgi:hypothetical protein
LVFERMLGGIARAASARDRHPRATRLRIGQRRQ